jgi:sugar lactone lactonase YvrE
VRVSYTVSEPRRLVKFASTLAVLMVVCAGWAAAEHTRRWRQSTYDEFLKGTTHGIAVRSDGRLELAPKFTQLADADASYLWAVKLDAKGTPYAAGGSPAKVFKLDASGKASTAFESNELSAQTIAFDAKGALYVGTSPDGKVYRVSASGEKSVFFDPKTKYIWDIAFGTDGVLYVATGDKGVIYAVTPDGKGEVFYASDEAHIRVLAFDGKGNLIAGTEPSGRVLRLSKAKGAANAAGFVLYETPKREVTALAVGADGAIYAAAIGERQHNAAVSNSGAASTATTTITSTGNVTVIAPTQGTGQAQTPFVAFPALISSGIYKIATDGAPEELWTSRDDVVYSLGIGGDGRLLAGLGNSGALLAIDGRGVFAQLAKAGSAQITGIVPNAAGKIFLCTANPGKLIAMGPEYEAEGTYESRSFDAQLFSQWGRMEWWSPPASSGRNGANSNSKEPRLEFYVHSGNTEDPGKEWSKWFGPYTASGTQTEIPAARFVQWKAVIHDGRPGDGIEWVSVSYQPKNVAPVIDGITLQDPGVRAQGQPNLAIGAATTASLKFPPAQTPSGTVAVNQAQSSGNVKFDIPPQGIMQKGYQSVLWTAHDDNEDDLRYAVFFRGEGEKDWKLMKDKLDQKFYSFDTTTLADGAYYLKIVASDEASNPPDKALKTERESERFELDNTPPMIGKVESVIRGGSAEIKFTATDNGSSIDRAQYSVDGGEWITLAPKSGISDGKQAEYDFSVSGLKAGEHTIAARAYDRFENAGSGKAVITIQ